VVLMASVLFICEYVEFGFSNSKLNFFTVANKRDFCFFCKKTHQIYERLRIFRENSGPFDRWGRNSSTKKFQVIKKIKKN
jgi:hypothetical protein